MREKGALPEPDSAGGLEQFFDLRQPLRPFAFRLADGEHDLPDFAERLRPGGRIGGQHLGNRGERAVAVEQQAKELFAQHLLELRQGQAAVFGAHLAQRLEGPFVHPGSRQADVDQTANHRLAQPALGEACLEFGDALLDEGDPLRFDAGAPARRFVRGPQSDQRLQQRRAVNAEEDLLHAAIAQIAIAIERGDDPVRNHGLHLEQGVVGRNRLALLANLLGELGDLLHQRVAVREQFVGQFGRVQLVQPFGRLRAGERLDKRLEQGAIQAEVDLRDPPRGGEARSFSGLGWTMARTSARARFSKRTIQSPLTRSGLAASAVLGVMTAS
jgi:hypothetical protein